MSAESVIMFYGVKFSLTEQDLEDAEKRKHQHQLRAREFGLDSYWGNFSAVEDEYLLLVGKKIGIFGVENDWVRELDDYEFERLAANTRALLKKANFDDKPKLLIQLEPNL